MEREEIYLLMRGLSEEKPPHDIADIFQDGRPCGTIYESAYIEKLRLLQKLGTEEDADLVVFEDNLRDITYYLAMKMYDYGAAA